jgi:hypothetical protein
MAAGAIGGAVLGPAPRSKANKQAAQTQNNATNAQLQLGRESMGLNREIYDKNTALLAVCPARQCRGDSINALLGLPSAPASLAAPAPAPAPSPASRRQCRGNPSAARLRTRWQALRAPSQGQR